MPLKPEPIRTEAALSSLLKKGEQAYLDWKKRSQEERIVRLKALAAVLRTHQDSCARLITQEMGKPLLQAAAEIEKCAQTCEYYAEHGAAFLEKEWIVTEYRQSYRSFHPMGVVLAIMPWNYPFWQVIRVLVPSLLLGNTLLLKHAPEVWGCALKLEECLLSAGFPPGVLQNLWVDPLKDPHLISFVMHNPSIIGVSFTGSAATARCVAAEAGAALKKVVLELGGSDAAIILEDANIAEAVQACVSSRLNNTGQVCIAAKRIIVVSAVAALVKTHILESVSHYHMGDPMREEVHLGPLARADLRAKLHRQVEQMCAQGARCVYGGDFSLQSDRPFYPLTVLFDVQAEHLVFQEELFGPVICVIEARDEEEALRLANQTPYGLGAAVYTRDLNKGQYWAEHLLEAGVCVVNMPVRSDPRWPFGGIKQSGYGRELSREGLREFANIKTVIVQ